MESVVGAIRAAPLVLTKAGGNQVITWLEPMRAIPHPYRESKGEKCQHPSHIQGAKTRKAALRRNKSFQPSYIHPMATVVLPEIAKLFLESRAAASYYYRTARQSGYN